jgi:hypothetical protein
MSDGDPASVDLPSMEGFWCLLSSGVIGVDIIADGRYEGLGVFEAVPETSCVKSRDDFKERPWKEQEE